MKKVMIFLLSLLLSISVCEECLADSQINGTQQTGDTNCDNSIDALDALSVLRYAVAGFPEEAVGFNAAESVVPYKSDIWTDLFYTLKEAVVALPDTQTPTEWFYLHTQVPDGYRFLDVVSNSYDYILEYYCDDSLFSEEAAISSVQVSFAEWEEYAEQITENASEIVSEFVMPDGTKAIIYFDQMSGVNFLTKIGQRWVKIDFSITGEALKGVTDGIERRKIERDFAKQYGETVFTDFISTCNFKKIDPGVVMAGDVNGDGKINAEDALYVLKYAVGKIDSFPVDQPAVSEE